MATTAETAKQYFAALSAHDLDGATACWRPGAIDRLVGAQDLVAPDGPRAYFSELFAAFPDFTLDVVELTTYRSRTAVRWRATGTFAGPGRFQGFAPNHARIEVEGCDVVTVADDVIVHNDAFIDSGAIARQLGFLPEAGSPAEGRLAKLANLRTRVALALHGAEAESIADGVWVVRGGFPIRTMNVYLIEERDGVTVFDAGISAMGGALRAACARLGAPAATLSEGDEVAGFRVVELPGHAPGLIGLFRESDRLALVSDLVYTLDIQTGIRSRPARPRIPHPAFDADIEQARAWIRKLADLGPSIVWAGHAEPVSGDVVGQLQQAAAAPL